MTGIERIKNRFSTNKKIKLMTHVVGGYPDLETCKAMILTMVKRGVDLIEIQLPFSDPIADGPIIVNANHKALKANVTTKSVLKLVEEIREQIDIPLLIMSYLNPLYAYGIESFLEKVKTIGIDGLIVPDCPLEEIELNIPQKCNDLGLAFVPLIAPTTSQKRMITIAENCSSPFVYAVLRLGVTGKKTNLDRETKEYLKLVKENTKRFVAAGFGIKEKAQLDALIGHVDCGIIGSAILRIVDLSLKNNQDPVQAVDQFLSKL